jgi:hypothetical protein
MRNEDAISINFEKRVQCFMSANDLKRELLAFIEETEDEALLSLLKEDVIFYGKLKDRDITDGLNKEQLEDLNKLAQEDSLSDTMTMDDYKKVTDQWRTK